MHICFHIADGSSHATGAEVTSYDKTPYDPYNPNNLWSDPLVSLLTFALDEEVELRLNNQSKVKGLTGGRDRSPDTHWLLVCPGQMGTQIPNVPRSSRAEIGVQTPTVPRFARAEMGAQIPPVCQCRDGSPDTHCPQVFQGKDGSSDTHCPQVCQKTSFD